MLLVKLTKNGWWCRYSVTIWDKNYDAEMDAYTIKEIYLPRNRCFFLRFWAVRWANNNICRILFERKELEYHGG